MERTGIPLVEGVRLIREWALMNNLDVRGMEIAIRLPHHEAHRGEMVVKCTMGEMWEFHPHRSDDGLRVEGVAVKFEEKMDD